MKLLLKKINLKENTEKDIVNNPTDEDIQKFIDYIKNHLQKIRNIIDNKLECLSNIELYDYLNEIFNIIVEPDDYLKLLSKMYEKHYVKFINFKTNMVDNNGNNIMYFGAITNKINCSINERLSLKNIRSLTNKYDLIVLKTIYYKEDAKISEKERFENNQFIEVDINNDMINKDSELFIYMIELLRKEILVKDILFNARVYLKELMYQVRSITNLAFINNDEKLSIIGKKYKRAFEMATNNGYLPKYEKIVVKNRKNLHK